MISLLLLPELDQRHHGGVSLHLCLVSFQLWLELDLLLDDEELCLRFRRGELLGHLSLGLLEPNLYHLLGQLELTSLLTEELDDLASDFYSSSSFFINSINLAFSASDSSTSDDELEESETSGQTSPRNLSKPALGPSGALAKS